jgi:hypothetical protein
VLFEPIAGKIIPVRIRRVGQKYRAICDGLYDLRIKAISQESYLVALLSEGSRQDQENAVRAVSEEKPFVTNQDVHLLVPNERKILLPP